MKNNQYKNDFETLKTRLLAEETTVNQKIK